MSSWQGWKKPIIWLRDSVGWLTAASYRAALTPLSVIWAEIRRWPVGAVIGAIALLSFVYYYKAPIWNFVTHAKNGSIIVNSPTVYTRQRLVNDRLDQARWLRKQLEITESKNNAFKMIDQVRGISLLNRVSAGGPASSADQKPTETPAESTTIEATTTAIFRAMNAYRDEVRSELTQTELDDRHDIKGNTIFRLTFDASVIAGTKSDAIAAIAVQLSHRPRKDNTLFAKVYDDDYHALYLDWVRYVQDTIRKSLGAMPKAIMSIDPIPQLRIAFSEFLLRRICQFSKGNPDISMQPAPCDDAAKSMATALLAKFAIERSEVIAEDKKKIFQSELDGFKAAGYIPKDYNYDAGYYSAASKCAEGNKERIALWEIGAPMKDRKLVTDLITCPFYDTISDRFVSGILLYEKAYEAAVTGSSLQNSLKADCGQGDCNIQPDRLRCFAADFIKANLNTFLDPLASPRRRIDHYLKLRIVGRETGNCNLLVLQLPKENQAADSNGAYNVLDDFTDALNGHTDAFAYSVTPKNLTENISTAAETRDAFELLFHTKVESNEVARFLRDRSAKQRAIVAHPIVVGFGSPSPINDGITNGPSSVRDIDFGWIIAAHSTTTGTFEQIDGQYPLTAFISVPSWWQTVEATVWTCWLSRTDLPNIRSSQSALALCPAESTPEQTHMIVRLPASIPEISRKLGFEVVQQPSLYQPVPKELTVGRRGSILLQGQRLWRSTEVTAGAQRADKITVLPNMEGIIAEFSCVHEPAGQRKKRRNIDIAADDDQFYTTDSVQVWTSEGVTEAVPVTFVWPKDLDPKQRICPDKNP